MFFVNNEQERRLAAEAQLAELREIAGELRKHGLFPFNPDASSALNRYTAFIERNNV